MASAISVSGQSPGRVQSDLACGADVPARYGGEEFVIILPNTTTKEAETVAQHIRSAVSAARLKQKSTAKGLGRITVSVGVARRRPTNTSEALLACADKAMYAAGAAGRNCVMSAADILRPAAV